MLQQLDISNYAIIDHISIKFADGLNAITGETGAGKSIILGALSLILGGRAETSAIRDRGKKAAIEGIFNPAQSPGLETFFRSNDLDPAEETILRREISPSGKSRAFINDTPVSLQQLSVLGDMLVNLHQQFDTLQLGDSDFQIEILDAFSGQKKQLDLYRQLYSGFQSRSKRFEELKERAKSLSRESDYDQFLFDELEEAHFEENELEDLSEELNTQSHVEELKQGLLSAATMLEGEEAGILSQLRMIENSLSSVASFHKKLPQLLERFSSVQIELEDLRSEVEQINEAVEFDEERMAFIQDRLNSGYKLLKKHQLQTTNELLALKEELGKKLEETRNLDEELESAEREYEKALILIKKGADGLSQNRKKVVPSFIQKLEALLKRVGMPNARLKIDFEKGDFSYNGADRITFGFDANKSNNFLPLRKVASGGELSRLMLCIKSLMATSEMMPTLVFDEIESGISGEAARQVGLLLEELGERHQVICISHQPQVAARAATHFQVYKQEKAGGVISNIRKLEQEERIKVIAEMLSGDRLTEASLLNAKELLER